MRQATVKRDRDGLHVRRGDGVTIHLKVWWRQCDPLCTGWLHMDDSMGRGPGIERCDECARFATDDNAEKAHARECGCGMKVATEPPCPRCGGATRPCSTGEPDVHCDACGQVTPFDELDI